MIFLMFCGVYVQFYAAELPCDQIMLGRWGIPLKQQPDAIHMLVYPYVLCGLILFQIWRSWS